MNTKTEELEIKNKGQRVIQTIIKRYEAGTLAVTENSEPEIQAMLNKPTAIKKEDHKISSQDKKFLKDLIRKVDAEKIKLFTPSTLLNEEVYNGLPKELQAKADYDILILIHKIRQIKKLWDDEDKDSYQMMNMVHSLRLMKEGLGKMGRDVFII